MKMRAKSKKNIATVWLVALIFSIMSGYSAFPASATSSSVALDISASNWTVPSGYSAPVDKANSTEFTGATAFGQGVSYSNNLDLSSEVSFDIKFTQQQITSGWIAVTLGQDSNSFNNANKGVTFILNKKNELAIECQQSLGTWRSFPFSETNTVKICQGTTGWELYFKNTTYLTDTLIATVPFTTVAKSVFTNNISRLSIYTYDAISSSIKFEISNLTHVTDINAPINYLLNNTAANWSLTSGYSSLDKTSSVEFTGVTTFGLGATYKNDIDLTSQVSFDIEYTQQTLAANGWIAFTVGQDSSSFNNTDKGVTFLLYKKNENAIQCAQGSSSWYAFPFSGINSIKIKQGATGWELYFKNTTYLTDTIIATVPFTTVAKSVFTNNTAKLSVYSADVANNAIKYEISNLAQISNPNVVQNVSLSNMAANWNLTSKYVSAVDKTGAVGFTGVTEYAHGPIYKNYVDITEVGFDIQFTQQQLEDNAGWVAFTLGKDDVSFNNSTKGVTFILYKKNSSAVQCGQNLGTWRSFPFGEVNSIRIKEGSTGWELYLKNSVITTSTLIATVPFTTVPISTFTNGKAKLQIVTSDVASNPIAFDISNFSHYTIPSVNFGIHTISSANIITNIGKDKTLTDFLVGVTTTTSKRLVFRNSTGILTATGVIGTGTDVSVYQNTNLYASYKTVIYGDVNGDGAINASDLIKVKKHILKADLLKDVYLIAADTDKNNVIAIGDLLAVKKQILNITNIAQ